MLCKKCGANISENSKFCGFCGEPVSVDDNVLHQDNNYDNENVNSEVDLGNTVRIEPVNGYVQNNEYSPVENSSELVGSQDINPSDELQFNSFESNDTLFIDEVSNQKVETDVMLDTFDSGEINQTINNNLVEEKQEQITEEVPAVLGDELFIDKSEVTIPLMEPIDTTKKEKKSANKVILIFLSIAILLLALISVAFVVTKSTNNSLESFKTALANFVEKGKDSATVDAKLSISTTTGESFSFSSKVKAQKKTEDSMDMQVTINKSMLFDEMNLYAEINKDKVKLYTQSNVIDMIGMTSSTTQMWIYYVLNLDELILEDDINSGLENIDLKEFDNLEKIVFISKTDDISRYQLTLDKELIEQINKEANTGLDTDSLDINNPIKIDFYINNSNELIKIQIDMGDSINELGDLSNCIMTIEFNDLGKTIVEIPSDAKNSIIDLETYMTNYSLNFGFEDENVDINLQ